MIYTSKPKMKTMKILNKLVLPFLLVTVISFIAWRHFVKNNAYYAPAGRTVEYTLKLARDNRQEFEKVLEHFKDDSLKLEAAKFLIKNMLYHSYYSDINKSVDILTNDLNEYKINYPDTSELYRELRGKLIDKEIKETMLSKKMTYPHYELLYDHRTIKADFLIENIEYAFKAWKLPWAKSFSFEEFCNFILPYRYGDEKPRPWRKIIFEKYKWIADSLINCEDVHEVVNLINKEFRYKLIHSEQLKKYRYKLGVASQLETMIYTTCYDQSGLGVCILRSLGIPSSLLTIPLWGNNASGHVNVAFMDSKKDWYQYSFSYKGTRKKDAVKAPKMYLDLFSNFTDLQNANSREYDMTSCFQSVDDIKINFNNTENHDEIYLCVFGDLRWSPLIKGEYKNNKIIFKDIGIKNLMFLLVGVNDQQIIPINAFSKDTLGNIKQYIPDFSNKFSSTFYRKYPFSKKMKKRCEDLIQGEFFAFADGNFNQPVSLKKITHDPDYKNTIFKINDIKTKKLKYSFPKINTEKFDGPSEIAFYTTENNHLKKLEGVYYGSPQLSENHIKILTDNDLLSYLEVWNCNDVLRDHNSNFVFNGDAENIWVALELDTIRTVTHVGICPRNDKNGVYQGMVYELLYWDHDWKSLGKKTATSDSITFDNIPSNSVLWLRNHSEGKEERIFTIENNEVIWW